jgi:hypothetical protein
MGIQDVKQSVHRETTLKSPLGISRRKIGNNIHVDEKDIHCENRSAVKLAQE